MSSRATIIIQNPEGQILFARNKGTKFFMLPGGGIERKDANPKQAAIRELLEETGIRVTKAKYLFQHRGKTRTHYVYSAETNLRGSPRMEISQLKWWDPLEEEPLNINPSSREILNRFI